MNTTATEQKDMSGISLAILCVGGNGSNLARVLGVSPQAISRWKRQGSVPIKQAIRIEQIFKIPRAKLNPIFR